LKLWLSEKGALKSGPRAGEMYNPTWFTFGFMDTLSPQIQHNMHIEVTTQTVFKNVF
jgi:hypothetical protein